MGRLSAAPCRRGKPEGGAHGAAHPGVVGRRGGPGAVIETAEHHQVGMKEPRLERPENGEPRMPAITRPYHERLEKGIEKRGIGRRLDHSEVRGIGHCGGKMRGQRLARLAAPEPLRARLLGRCRQRFGAVEMKLKERRESHLLAFAQGRFQGREEPQDLLELSDPRLRHPRLLQRLNERL